jgi:hypothetical protein
MNRRDFVSIILASTVRLGYAQAESEIPIVVSPRAAPLTKFAASELSKYLHLLYPGSEFRVRESSPQAALYIHLGTPKDSPELSKYVTSNMLARPDSFMVTTATEGQTAVGVIVGADASATLFAVYALLEKLGFGFYLSYDAYPDPRLGPFRFDGWQLADAPLSAERIVFNWHNFLSGCSGWSLPDWQNWISQVAKMRYSSIMVHAYGNNPMYSFTYNGQRKPTGFWPTSAKGRDWGAEHVNDVRRIFGGEQLFQSPVFGSSAALVPAEQTVEAATSLMQQVFAFARSRGLGVNFALDLDTFSSNPQNIIATLPERATFRKGNYRLPNPETPEGLDYYRSQMHQLLNAYPEIDRIVVWFRHQGDPWSPWRVLQLRDFPVPWQREFRQALEKLPARANDPGLFAISKIVRALRKSLDDLGKGEVQLATGCWEYDYIFAADAFMPAGVSMICIDQYNQFVQDQDVQREIRNVSARRKVIPIPYAQDDDGHYAGRPYTPGADLSWTLKDCGCAGIGIIHWTTRPLDIYFKSFSTQVWSETQDQPLSETCYHMAERTFGKTAREEGGRYLLQWITEAPMFGCESTNAFIEHPLGDAQAAIIGCQQRLQTLDKISRLPLSAKATERIAYYRDWENFVLGFFRSHSAWEQSVALGKKGELAKAREALADCKPEAVLEQYARMASGLGITSGEKGLLVSMNLRWLPYIVSQRQALGVESVRVKFMPTTHEPLAQAPGLYTFFIDRDHRLWIGLGEKETGVPAFARSDPPEEVNDAGLESDRPFSLTVRCMMGEPLLPGSYNAKLLFARPSVAEEESVVDLEIRGSNDTEAVTDHVDLAQKLSSGLPMASLSYPVKVKQGELRISLKPEKGKVFLCGAVIEPVNTSRPRGALSGI